MANRERDELLQALGASGAKTQQSVGVMVRKRRLLIQSLQREGGKKGNS